MQHSVDEAGDRLMDGEWLGEFIERFADDVCPSQPFAEVLYSVAGWHDGREPQHPGKAMRDLDAFGQKHLRGWWEPFVASFVREKAGLIMCVRFGLPVRGHRDWQPPNMGELLEGARAEGLPLLVAHIRET